MRTKLHLPLLSRLALAFTLAWLLGPGAPPAVGDPLPDAETPPEVQKGIEAALRAKVGALLAEKNDKGEPYRRGIYSRSFHRVDDSTYQVGLHVDRAMGPDLEVERYLVTLTQNTSGDWVISKEELKESFDWLHRRMLGDEECFHFDTFTFAREGLKVSASNGSMCKDFYNGNVSDFDLASADLVYSYIPPIKQDEMLFGLLKKEREPDLVFPPDYALVSCDPGSCQKILATSFTGLRPIKIEETDQALQKAYSEYKSDVEKNLKENRFWGFRMPYEPDRQVYSVAIKSNAVGDHWFRLSHDSYNSREISVFATGFDGQPLYQYYSEQTRNSGLAPYDLEGRPDAEARFYEMRSLKGTVEMGFGDGETLTGDITYGLKTRNKFDGLPFSISRLFQQEENKARKNPKMTINSIQDGEGNELTWAKTGAYTGLVMFPRTIPAGTDLTLRLQFENRDSVYKLTPSFSYVDRGGWLPFVRFADFIEDFDLTVKVPAKYKTLGIGKKVSEVKKEGVSITRWVGGNPVSFPTVIFGDYFETPSHVTAKKIDGSEIPVVIHIDRQSIADTRYVADVQKSRDDVEDFQIYELKVTMKKAQDFIDQAANSLNLFREILGIDYPFAKLDLVNDPLGGFYGQAPSSLIYLGNPDFYSKGVLAGGLEAGAGLSTFQDSVVSHEVAHQWWGSLVCNVNDSNYWFVESLAEYMSALYTENYYGKKKYQEHVEAWRKEILDADMRGSVQDGYTIWQGPGGFAPYRAALYSKGPYAFHIMRSTWGDEAFFKFLKTLANELKGKEIVTRDIQKIAEKTFGANLDWFFDQWLRGVGLPEFTFTYKVREAEDGSQIIEGDVSQRTMIKPASAVKEELKGQFFKGIVPITIIGKSGKEYRKRLVLEGEKTAFKFNIPEVPKDIVFNKYGESLAYDVRVNPAS